MRASLRAPSRKNAPQGRRILERGHDHVGASARFQVRGQISHEACEHPTAVRPSVERKARAEVGVGLGRGRRQVREIRKDPIEPTVTAEQFGPDRVHRKAIGERPGAEPAERRPIQIRGENARASPRGAERRDAISGPHLGDRRPRWDIGVGDEKERILPRRVHLEFVAGGRRFSVGSVEAARWLLIHSTPRTSGLPTFPCPDVFLPP